MNSLPRSLVWHKSRTLLFLLVAFSAAFSPAMPTLGSQSESPAAPPALGNQPASPSAPLTEPDIIVDESVNTYTITNGLLYWGNYCYGDEFRVDGYLRRMPSHGGARVTLQTTTTADCVTFWYMAADASGVYYANLEPDPDQIEFRSASNPGEAVILSSGTLAFSITTFALDESYIYWGNTVTNQVYRLPKTGGIPTVIASTGSGLENVVMYYSSLYWMDSTGLWSCSAPDCASPTQQLTLTGKYLLSTPQGLFMVELSNPQRIHYIFCIVGCVDLSVVYTAPVDWTIYNMALGKCANLSDYCLFWTESTFGTYSRLQRTPASGGTVETIADNLTKPNIIATDDQGVYFQLLDPNPNYLGRLPYSATVVQRDIQVAAWEVTQVNQSLDNDVPLVAHKTTYVRVYPSLWGEHANFVNAQLFGWRGATPLPGSPLTPLGGTIDLNSSYTYNRSDPYSGYLFQLPYSWTEAGVTTLQASVDPGDVYADQWPDNNSRTAPFTFGNKPPVCDIFIPVRTNTPAASVQAPNFWRMIDLQKRLWPVPDVWVYYQDNDVTEPEFCWKWGFIPWVCDGPFELNEGSSWGDWIPDAGEALLHISTRATFTDDPDECTGAVHYVGMVHPNANTGSTNGIAYTYDWMEPASWVKLAPATFDPPIDWTWPRAGVTLAHETSHNHERAHVDCGGPDDPGYYPYPACQLDDATDPTHFGFDINLRQPIGPTQAADYMSYADHRWASDYTYKAMYGRFATSEVASSPVLSAAAEAVLFSANVNTALNVGELHYAWVYPTAGMSSNMLGKWEKLLAPPYIQSAANPNAVNYHLRLMDASSATLADYALTPLSVDEYLDEESSLIFQQTFTAPTGVVARMELMADEAVLVSREPGVTLPEVDIQLPAGGEVFTDAMTISWQASDPDEDILLFNIQYSPDGGLTWRSIAENVMGAIEGDTSSLELDDLAGLAASDGATGLIQVAASDGYHTSLATSAAFTVADQPPQVYILSPELTHIYPAGENVPLRGGAMDPETGGISGDQLGWTINGFPYGVGEENSVDGLAPGSYFVNLQATDPVGITATQTTLLNIGRLVMPNSASALTLDGSCEDLGYTDLVLRLKPDGLNNQAFVALTRTTDGLWACFSGMRYIEGQSPGAAGLLVDVNNSRDWLAQTDDYGFFVGEGGTPLTVAGDGAGGFTNPGPEGMLAQVGVQGGNWSAELYIPSSLIGGWNHPIGLAAEAVYNWTPAAGNEVMPNAAGVFAWPYNSIYVSPLTWAWTLLGTPPVITSLSPETITAGGAQFTLTLDGEGFQDGAIANWSGTSLATTYSSSTQVTAEVGANLIASSMYALVTVTNPDLMVSDPVIFTVENPAPLISSLSPSMREAGSEAFTLTVIGSGFVDGVHIIWNGEVLETMFVDGNNLQATISAEQVVLAQQVGVVVQNPQPAGGTSNIMTFTIEAGNRFFLPVLLR